MKMPPALQRLASRFDARSQRERKLLMFGVPGALALCAYSLLVEPAWQQASAQAHKLATQHSELDSLKSQVVALRSQVRDPDAPNRAARAEAEQQIGKVEKELQAFDTILVPPAMMPRLLQSLLAKHRGLELVTLKTLPVTPLLQTPTAVAGSPGSQAVPPPAAGADKASPPPGGMYRHGIEMTISGTYADLTAYAEELQRISPRPLWSAMNLRVVEYPRSELTFTLYTLSLDLPWLAI